jgi:hypothetical protein
MGSEFIYELYYYFFNTAYYKIMVLKDGEKIKNVIQKVNETEEGRDNFIIIPSMKAAWFKLKDRCFRDGKKFLMFVDLNNALPLVIDSSELIVKENIFIKTVKVTKFKIDETIQLDKNTGLPIKFVELTLPSTLLYQALEANFVKKINSEEKGKWDWLMVPLIILFVVFGVIGYMMMAKQGTPIT